MHATTLRGAQSARRMGGAQEGMWHSGRFCRKIEHICLLSGVHRFRRWSTYHTCMYTSRIVDNHTEALLVGGRIKCSRSHAPRQGLTWSRSGSQPARRTPPCAPRPCPRGTGTLRAGLAIPMFLAARPRYTRRVYGHFQQGILWLGPATHGSGQPELCVSQTGPRGHGAGRAAALGGIVGHAGLESARLVQLCAGLQQSRALSHLVRLPATALR